MSKPRNPSGRRDNRSKDQDEPFIHPEHDDDGASSDGSWHLVPVDDSRQHTFDTANPCWCEPFYDEETGYHIHFSADGREAYEEGLRKPH